MIFCCDPTLAEGLLSRAILSEEFSEILFFEQKKKHVMDFFLLEFIDAPYSFKERGL